MRRSTLLTPALLTAALCNLACPGTSGTDTSSSSSGNATTSGGGSSGVAGGSSSSTVAVSSSAAGSSSVGGGTSAPPSSARGSSSAAASSQGGGSSAAGGSSSGVGSSSQAAASSSSGGHAIKTVFVILMENQNWDAIKDSADAPYINNTLLPMASYADNYKGAIRGTNPVHPSEPNYIWLEAGDNLGIGNDADPSANHQSTTEHLVTQLNAAGISWKSYQEDIVGDVCPLTSHNGYKPKHDPMVFFDDVTGGNDPNNAYCISHNRPYSELAGDLTNNLVARYNFLTPNICNDMHDSCAPLNNKVLQGDTWLSQQVPIIMASAAYQDGGAIFILWDESEPSLTCLSLDPDCAIGMIVVSPLAKGGGYHNTTAYRHSSMLRSVQEIFGVGPLLRDAANATNLADLFTAFP